MSCCVRKKASRAEMKKKSCCDTPCGESGDTLPRSQNESSSKIPVVVRKAFEKPTFLLSPTAAFANYPVVLKRETDSKARFARPPSLYLQNHAFLI